MSRGIFLGIFRIVLKFLCSSLVRKLSKPVKISLIHIQKRRRNLKPIELDVTGRP